MAIQISKPFVPEFLTIATYTLGYIATDANVFEFGSGQSTLFLAQRCKKIVSVEHNPEWFKAIESAANKYQLDNIELVLSFQNGIADKITKIPGQFDLVIVDCYDRQRVKCVRNSISRVVSGGFIVLDDSQRNMFREAFKLLRGWHREDISGFNKNRRDGNTRQVTTTFFQKP